MFIVDFYSDGAGESNRLPRRVKDSKQMGDLTVDVSMTVVKDYVVGTAADVFLRQLATNPFESFLASDAVASHDTVDADIKRRHDRHHLIYIYARVKATVIVNGTFEPVHPRLFKVVGYSGMHHGVDGLLVFLVLEQIGGEGAFLQLSVREEVLADKFRERTLQGEGGAHEAFRTCIAVVDVDAPCGQSLAYKRFSATDATCNSYFLIIAAR